MYDFNEIEKRVNETVESKLDDQRVQMKKYQWEEEGRQEAINVGHALIDEKIAEVTMALSMLDALSDEYSYLNNMLMQFNHIKWVMGSQSLTGTLTAAPGTFMGNGGSLPAVSLNCDALVKVSSC